MKVIINYKRVKQKIYCIIFPLLILSGINTLEAQKFGEISKEDFLTEKHPLDSSAVAVYLLKNCTGKYIFKPSDIKLELEYHDRILILDERGSSYANYNIPLCCNGKRSERIKGLKAFTYNLENGKVIRDKFDTDNIYKEESSENLERVKFALPNVKKGTIIDVKYKLQTPFIYTIPRWYFQSQIPVDYSKYEITVPSYFTFAAIPSGKIKVTTTEKEMRSSKHGGRKYTMVAENIAPLIRDNYILSPKDYLASLKYELYSVKLPDRAERNLSKDWAEISKNLLESKTFGKFISKKDLKKFMPIINKAKSLEMNDRYKFIHEYVRTTFTWNKKSRRATESSFSDFYESKVGNSAEINLLLIRLLNAGGIKTYPVAIKTRSRGLLNKKYPSLTELNYVVAFTEIANKLTFIDATANNIPPGQLPIRATNINGLLIDKENSRVIRIKNPNNFSKQTFTEYKINIDAPGLYGVGSQRLKGYAATLYRMTANNSEGEDITENEIENEPTEELEYDNKYLITSSDGIEDINASSIQLKFDKEIYNHVRSFGSKIFIDATLDFGIKSNPFIHSKRLFPVYFKQLSNIKNVVSIEIPENYIIESVPEKTHVALPGNKGVFIYEVKDMSDKLMIYYTLKINTDVIPSEEYPYLSKFYEEMMIKQNEKIVLSEKL